MAITVPSNAPSWADGGGASVTDPGASKQATGFIAGEAPAAGHHNFILKAQGDWIDALRDALALQTLLKGVDFTGDGTPLGGFGTNISYLNGIDKWFSWSDNSGNVDFHESEDGVTWSAATNKAYSAIIPGNFTEDAAKVYTAAGSSGIASFLTSAAISTIALETNTFANLTSIARVIWDDVNDVFIAGGAAGANADIETSTAMGGTWTQRYTTAGDIMGMAHDPVNGITVAFENGATEYVYTSNGTTWNTDTSPTVSAYNCYYNAALGKFVFHLSSGASQKLGFTTDGTDYFEVDFGGSSAFAAVINIPAGVLCFEQHGSNAVDSAYLITASDHPTDSAHLNIEQGQFSIGTSGHMVNGPPSVGYDNFDCTNGVAVTAHRQAVWSYDSAPYLAVAKY